MKNAIFASLMYELDATLNKKSSKQWVKQIVNLEAIENPISILLINLRNLI